MNAIHPPAADLRRAPVPRRRQQDAKVDRPGGAGGIDRRHHAIDTTVRRHAVGGIEPRRR
jgi:hypothetical protein